MIRRVAFLLVILLISPPALARGVSADSARIEENLDNHAWKLKLTLDHGAVPDRDMVELVFSFKQTAIYDRELTDASPDKPTPRTTPLVNATPAESPQEADFRDANGKRQRITKLTIT